MAFIIRLVFGLAFVLHDSGGCFDPLNCQEQARVGVDGYIQIAYTLLHHGRYAFDSASPEVSFRGPVQPILMLVTCAWSTKYWAYLLVIVFSLIGASVVSCLWSSCLTKNGPTCDITKREV